MFLAKKILTPLLLPMTLCLGILVLGLCLLFFTRRKKAGKALLAGGVLFLGLFSFAPLSTFLLRGLEYRYPPLLSLHQVGGVKWIVVLGGGHASDPSLPPVSQLSRPSLIRLAEGVRIHRGLPGSKLLLSGGAPFKQTSEARIMAAAAEDMGTQSKDLVLEESSKDTEEQARLIHPVVGQERFVLVTSASHMPRSVALFRKLRMDPIPAPTDYLVKESREMSPGMFYPAAENLHKAERVFYEYLGMAWSKLRGRI